jgi:hypothetical protein
VWCAESELTFRRNISPASSGLKISQARNQHEGSRKCLSASWRFLAWLSFDLEYGRDVLRNVWLSPYYTAVITRKTVLSRIPGNATRNQWVLGLIDRFYCILCLQVQLQCSALRPESSVFSFLGSSESGLSCPVI